MAATARAPITEAPCALCGRGDTPPQLTLTTQDPAGYRSGWACAGCAAAYPDDAARILALFRRLTERDVDAAG